MVHIKCAYKHIQSLFWEALGESFKMYMCSFGLQRWYMRFDVEQHEVWVMLNRSDGLQWVCASWLHGCFKVLRAYEDDLHFFRYVCVNIFTYTPVFRVDLYDNMFYVCLWKEVCMYAYTSKHALECVCVCVCGVCACLGTHCLHMRHSKVHTHASALV